MSSTPDIPAEEAALAKLREEIDEMKQKSEEELVSPLPSAVAEEEPTPGPTDAIGSEKWESDDTSS